MSDDSDGVETPAAGLQTRAGPESVRTKLENHEGQVSLGLISENIQGRLYLETDQARELGEELLTVAEEASEEAEKTIDAAE